MFHRTNSRTLRALAIGAALAALLPATSAQALTGASTSTYVPQNATPVPRCCGTTSVAAPPSVAPGAGATARSASARSTNPGHSPSNAAIAIAVLAALVILGCVLWAVSRRRALEPHWLFSLRHAMAEAGLHASATWAEFADFVRLGR